MAFGLIYPRARISAITRADGTPYPPGEWRNFYVGMTGSVEVRQSEHRHPGQYWIYFSFPEKDADGANLWLQTSCGDLTVERERIMLVTPQSRYDIEILGA